MSCLVDEDPLASWRGAETQSPPSKKVVRPEDLQLKEIDGHCGLYLEYRKVAEMRYRDCHPLTRWDLFKDTMGERFKNASNQLPILLFDKAPLFLDEVYTTAFGERAPENMALRFLATLELPMFLVLDLGYGMIESGKRVRQSKGDERLEAGLNLWAGAGSLFLLGVGGVSAFGTRAKSLPSDITPITRGSFYRQRAAAKKGAIGGAASAQSARVYVTPDGTARLLDFEPAATPSPAPSASTMSVTQPMALPTPLSQSAPVPALGVALRPHLAPDPSLAARDTKEPVKSQEPIQLWDPVRGEIITFAEWWNKEQQKMPFAQMPISPLDTVMGTEHRGGPETPATTIEDDKVTEFLRENGQVGFITNSGEKFIFQYFHQPHFPEGFPDGLGPDFHGPARFRIVIVASGKWIGRIDVSMNTAKGVATLSGFYPFENHPQVPVRMIETHIATIEVEVKENYHKDYSGIGATLLGLALRIAKSLEMESFRVTEIHSGARPFYEKMGFSSPEKSEGYVWDLTDTTRPLPALGITKRDQGDSLHTPMWTDSGSDLATFSPSLDKEHLLREHIKMLQSADTEERRLAAFVLGELGSPKAIGPLIRALEAHTPPRMVIYALLKLKAKRAADTIAAKLGDKDLRMAAAYALGKLGSKRAIKPLHSRLGDLDLQFNDAVIEALRDLGISDVRGKLVEAYTTALNNADPEIQKGAAAAIGNYSLTECSKALIAFVDRNQFISSSVAWALGRVGDKDAIEPLLAHLGQSYMEPNEAIENALTRLGVDKAQIERRYILTLGAPRDEYVKEYALRRLASLRGPLAFGAILSALDNTDNVLSVRLTAIEALRALGDKHAADELFARFGSNPRDDCYESAMRAIGAMGDARALDPLKRALDNLLHVENTVDGWISRRRFRVVQALAAFRNPDVIPQLEEAKTLVKGFLAPTPYIVSGDYTAVEAELKGLNEAIAELSTQSR